jgi:hypothetical protein
VLCGSASAPAVFVPENESNWNYLEGKQLLITSSEKIHCWHDAFCSSLELSPVYLKHVLSSKWFTP